MSDTHSHTDADLGEFAQELRLLAEAVLERVEPVLRRAAAEGRTEWGGCSWCPICAAAAVIRGEHHDVVAAIAEHGTAVVMVLREALAGVPVDPVGAPAADPAAGSEGGETQSGEGPGAARRKSPRTSPPGGSGPRRAGYTPIDVTIKV